MADQVEEILDVPREFFKDGVQFINRCQKRTKSFLPRGSIVDVFFFLLTYLTIYSRPEGVPQAVPGRRHRLRRDGRSRIRRQAECVFCFPQSRNCRQS